MEPRQHWWLKSAELIELVENFVYSRRSCKRVAKRGFWPGARKITTMTLHTIGYEGSNIECCLLALRKHGIDTVLDVRELPLSRKSGFSKRALEERLGQNGIEYIHMPALGCPKAIRVRYRDDHDWSSYTKAFIQYLDTQTAALEALVEKAAKSTRALLCFEANPSNCHRSLVASAVAQRHLVSVCHILSHEIKAGDAPPSSALQYGK